MYFFTNITQMHRRSKAMAAGVEVGDILIAINGHHCNHWTTDQAMDTINHSIPADDVTLHLLRYVGHSKQRTRESFIRKPVTGITN